MMRRLSATLALLAGCVSLPHAETFTAIYKTELTEVVRPKAAKERWGGTERISVADTTRFQYEDGMITAIIAPMHDRVIFSVKNKTENSVKIVWDEASFVDADGRVSKVMHNGVKYADRNQSQPPSMIPAGLTIEDEILPNDRVSFDEGWGYGSYVARKPGWQHAPLIEPSANVVRVQPEASPIVGDAFVARMKGRIGKRMGVILPLQIEGVTSEYTFWFTIRDATVSAPARL